MAGNTDYVRQIREWVAGDLYPDHDTFSFGREFGAGLIAQIDRGAIALAALADLVALVEELDAERDRP